MTTHPISATNIPMESNLTRKPLWLITGAAGFIGARMVERCNERGFAVISADDLQAFSSRPEHSGLDFGTKVDFRDLWTWLAAHPGTRPDVVIHLGACSSTTELNVEFLRRVNVEYSQKIWDYCTRNSIPLCYASSAATYGGGELGYADDESAMDHLKPLNPYGESKRLFDVWAIEQEKKGSHPPAWSGHKFFNVYGFGERHKGGQASVVLHAYDQICKSGGVRLFKSHREGIAHGHQSRDFIFVRDVIDILEFAATHPVRRGIYNVGTGEARTFLDLTRAVFKSMGQPEQIEFIDTPEAIRERYQYFTQATTRKLRDAGYTRAFTSLEEGVKATVGQLEAFGRLRN